MEENALAFPNLEAAIKGFVDDFISTYKELLIKDNKKASGNLIDSLKPLTVSFSNGYISGTIEIASYWKYVELGRRPGKFPPTSPILDWIKVKPVLPRQKKGVKPPTEAQLAFLISRKIARDGIKPGRQYAEAIKITWDKWDKLISDALSKDLQAAVDLIKI